MSLKEKTAAKHKLAESTSFMRKVFNGTLPREQWVDFTYQKYCWYSAIELKAAEVGVLKLLPGVARSYLIYQDYVAMTDGKLNHDFNTVSLAYAHYIQSLKLPSDIIAHLYTWHMGDMYGGQMIARLINEPHSHLVFENRDHLIATVRSLINDDMAGEANIAFDWAIKILQTYDN